MEIFRMKGAASTLVISPKIRLQDGKVKAKAAVSTLVISRNSKHVFVCLFVCLIWVTGWKGQGQGSGLNFSDQLEKQVCLFV